ncbi:hypothetical protein HYPSUDRAFT_208137 [Hypholoma sublateritium FD-334 SS-4]|uniref:Uncharacterized protein n=1 Tax=Hypholoma sublateritium (strain FD-334 SS-4) TaxID=945553 RepID=A0A0D2LWD8_HYPSF|nr:hypothetical protein HYPSUDRAFT_208137 [Hypholoma sublateritium FD-334 SS-4]
MYYPTLSRRGLKAKAKTAYARITLNRYTTAFFVFSFIYCFIQGLVQSFLFSTDVAYSTVVSGIVRGGNIPFKNITYLEGSSGNLILRICNDIPHGQPVFPCITIFNSTVDSSTSVNGSVRSLGAWQKGMDVLPISGPPPTNISGVNITVPDSPSMFLSEQCLETLVYPSQILKNFIREDITWVCLQFWLVAISFLAILNDSVPHVLAVLMTRTISTAWAAYAIWRGPTFNSNFEEIIASPGSPCSLEVFASFFSTRQGFEIADLILSCTGLIFFSYLSWTLLQIYSAQSFKCVGAPEHVMRIHKFFMAVLACLQMEAFVLTAGMGLWINVLTSTSIKLISEHTGAYQAVYITSVVLLLPWIAMGWYSIRREMRRLMVIFLAIGFIITTGWAVMFDSIVFRWTFVQWPYLGCFTVSSFVLLAASVTLGIVCRINFGKGLAEYLRAESALAALNFVPDEFAHRADSVRFSKDFKQSTARSSLETHEDLMNAEPMFFVSTLSGRAAPAESGTFAQQPSSSNTSRSTVIMKTDLNRRPPVPF